jgi:hypothetical protein
MKIIVKHLGSEIEVSDTQESDSNNRSLLFHNESYSIKLLEKIVEQIRLLHLEQGGDK